MLDKAFDALSSYNWGVNRKVLKPIDDAVVASGSDAAKRKKLELRLAAVLKTKASRDAKQFVLRKLRVIGTAASVPTIARLLSHKDHSHMARYALERIPDEEAAKAMRDALPKLSSELKIGMMSSLGVRQDEKSVPLCASILDKSNDDQLANAAAYALGAIRSESAAKVLVKFKIKTAAVIDASMGCAEKLLATGNKTDARAIYKGLIGSKHPKHVRLAATRGLLACAGKTK